MLGARSNTQPALFIVCSIGDLIPEDHILKRVDRILDLSWFRSAVAERYDEFYGRPSIDPEAAIRLMLAGFFLGVVHDRQLMRDAQVNIAIRWFAGYELEDQLPDHSTLTRIRQRWGSETFRTLFRQILQQCKVAGLVTAETVHIDATLIRADASWDSYTEEHVEKVLQSNAPIGTKPKARVSTTDPEATLATNNRNRKMEPSYKQHIAVDDGNGVIVDVSATTGQGNEGDEILSQIGRLQEFYDGTLKAITADAGYAYGKVYAAIESLRMKPIIPPKRVWAGKGSISIHQFKYDQKHDVVKCPRNKELHRTSRCGNHGWYYKSRSADCRGCDLRSRCLSPAVNRRTLVIGDFYPALLRARRQRSRWDQETIRLYERHRWRVEGVHAEGKYRHGLRRAVRRGIENLEIQSYLTATVINLKRMAA